MNDAINLNFGRRLRRRRRLMGLSQEALGARCGVRFQQIQKYESAANRMSAVMIGRLAWALEVHVGYFYEGLDALMAEPPESPADRPRRQADDAGGHAGSHI